MRSTSKTNLSNKTKIKPVRAKKVGKRGYLNFHNLAAKYAPSDATFINSGLTL